MYSHTQGRASSHTHPEVEGSAAPRKGLLQFPIARQLVVSILPPNRANVDLPMCCASAWRQMSLSRRRAMLLCRGEDILALMLPGEAGRRLLLVRRVDFVSSERRS